MIKYKRLGKPKLITLLDVICNQAYPLIRMDRGGQNKINFMMAVDSLACFMYPKSSGIEPGFCVLDYGCGPGSYIEPLAQLVGSSCEIYALDIHPLAIKKVQIKASQRAIMNLKTIESDCDTGLPDDKRDFVNESIFMFQSTYFGSL